MASSPQVETVVFAEDGDITFLLSPDESGLYMFKFVVSSHALRLASPVWRAMLSGDYHEGSTTHRIPLPDDDAGALGFLMNMVHMKYFKT